MNRQRQAKGKERLQALYLLKTVQCQQIIKVAVLIGRSRSTVHRWLDDYQQGGLPQLIGPGKKPGRKRKIPDWAVKQLEKRRQQPRGNYRLTSDPAEIFPIRGQASASGAGMAGRTSEDTVGESNLS